MAKNSPNRPSHALDILGKIPLINKYRGTIAKILGGVLIAHGGGRVLQHGSRSVTGFEDKPEITAPAPQIKDTYVSKALRQAADTAKMKRGGYWEELEDKPAGIGERFKKWVAEDVLPVEEIKEELKKTRESAERTKDEITKKAEKKWDSTMEFIDDAAYYIGFVLTIIAELKLAGLLTANRRKEEEEKHKERMRELEKEGASASLEVKKAQAEAEIAKARAETAKKEAELDLLMQKAQATLAQLQQQQAAITEAEKKKTLALFDQTNQITADYVVDPSANQSGQGASH